MSNIRIFKLSRIRPSVRLVCHTLVSMKNLEQYSFISCRTYGYLAFVFERHVQASRVRALVRLQVTISAD